MSVHFLCDFSREREKDGVGWGRVGGRRQRESVSVCVHV